MFDYRNYQPEQFATDPSFRNWKLKGTREDSRFWTEWVAANPNKQRDIEKASLLLEAVVESFDQISDREVRHEVQRLAGQLDQLPDIATELPGPPTHRWWQLRAYPMAAAVLIGLVGLGWWLLRGYSWASAPLSYELLVEATTIPLTEFVNTTASAHRLSLPDGSIVTLQSGSKVSYQADFTGDNREVYLSGEGFFEVTRDPQKPFLVYANQLVTKVLGTSFSVKANSAEDQVEVMVKTGRVAVYANTGAAGGNKGRLSSEVVLKPNQKLVYLWQQNLFSKGLVEDPQLVMAPEAKPSFSFKGTPIDQVFEELEKAYGIEIVFDRETMQDCYLTASFTDEPLFEKLDLITRTLGASYQQADGQIVVTSRGCRP